MEHNHTSTTRSRAHRAGFEPGQRIDPLQWLEMSFTSTGFTALKAFRVQLSKKTDRPVALGQALDALIKSHPFVAGHEPPRS